MEILHFNVMIDASREEVWDILWSDVTFPGGKKESYIFTVIK
ncbi:MAG: hypothetical protein WD317_11690 [Balneolaceae bacterium]